MIEFTKAGLKFEDPDKQVLIFSNKGMLTVFDPNTQLEEAASFLRDFQKTISFVYMGEAGEYLRLPNMEDRNGKKWIGFACSNTDQFDIEGQDIMQLMQDIPTDTHCFYVYKG